MRVRVQESLRAVFYTPYYLSLSLDTYQNQGLEVAFSQAPEPGQAASSLFDGVADVTWGGPMRMLQFMDSHGDGAVVGFAEAVTRDPFFLVGREPRPDFRLSDLRELRLGTVSEVPTPWLCLRDDLVRAGLSPDTLARVADRSMAENVLALREGRVDVIQIFEPFVEHTLSSGEGHLWYAAAQRGHTSYTTYYARREYAAAHPEALAGLAAGLFEAQKWLYAHPASAVAERVAEYFPDLPQAVLTGAIERYLHFGVWGRDPVLPLEGFVRLKAALIAGGFIHRDIAFETCVDNRFAAEVRGSQV